jgi:DinB superfamily
MTEEEARIRSYLEAQGAKLSPAAIIEKVRAAMAELRAAAASVPSARFHDRPEPAEWSGNEVMAHVVDAGNHFGGQIVRALDGLPPVESSMDRTEKPAPRHTAPEWCAILERDREALFERVLQADPTARLDKRIEHGMFGTLNWRETLLFLRLHDLDHARQLEKNAAALA